MAWVASSKDRRLGRRLNHKDIFSSLIDLVCSDGFRGMPDSFDHLVHFPPDFRRTANQYSLTQFWVQSNQEYILNEGSSRRLLVGSPGKNAGGMEYCDKLKSRRVVKLLLDPKQVAALLHQEGPIYTLCRWWSCLLWNLFPMSSFSCMNKSGRLFVCEHCFFSTFFLFLFLGTSGTVAEVSHQTLKF